MTCANSEEVSTGGAPPVGRGGKRRILTPKPEVGSKLGKEA
jgi:hypothetical protein